jgi:hypothetical protein
MGETLNLQFHRREDGSFEIQVKESWSGHLVRGDFIPPFNARQLHKLLRKLNTQESSERELIEIGRRLFDALCGVNAASIAVDASTKAGLPGKLPLRSGGAGARGSAEHSVQAMLRSVIQRTLRRRGTVALTLIFEEGCEAFISYPWELLHNDEHFLLVVMQ